MTHQSELISPEDDAKLAAQIVDAMKAVDAADAVKKEKAVAAGRLLAEAQKRHPTEEAFKKFLLLAGGVQIRRAQDLIALALGRKDFEQQQAENAAAQQRHRDKLKAEKIEMEKEKEPKPKPTKSKPDALRNASTTESAAVLEYYKCSCRSYLPRLNEADLKKAIDYFNSGAWKSKTKRKAA
jgi:hypothetical protein